MNEFQSKPHPKFKYKALICPGFCPEFKSIWTNGPLSLKTVGHFRKYGALLNFPYMMTMVYQHLDIVRIFMISAFKHLGLKITDNTCKF